MKAAARLQKRLVLPQAARTGRRSPGASTTPRSTRSAATSTGSPGPDDDHLGVLIADASGHGIPAAMVAIMARLAFVEAAARDGPAGRGAGRDERAAPGHGRRAVRDRLLRRARPRARDVHLRERRTSVPDLVLGADRPGRAAVGPRLPARRHRRTRCTRRNDRIGARRPRSCCSPTAWPTAGTSGARRSGRTGSARAWPRLADRPAAGIIDGIVDELKQFRGDGPAGGRHDPGGGGDPVEPVHSGPITSLI